MGPDPKPANRYVLLENPKVRSWHEARSLKSRLSADVDLRKLRLLLSRLELDPERIVVVAVTEPDRLQDMLIRYAAEMKRAGRVDDYIAKTLSGLKSYLRFRRIPFAGFPALNPIRGSTLANERVPSPEELGRVLERLSLRGRTIALLMAHAGVRPQVVGDYTGELGLTLADLPELDVRRLEFEKLPFVVRVPAALSKTRASYVSFGTGQLAATLTAYLGDRRRADEALGPTSPVVASTQPRNLRGATRAARLEVAKGRRFMVTGALVHELREALHASAPEGVSWRPYVLRSYCSTRLLLAEGSGKISRDLREEILGHDTGISGRYNVGKRWGRELLDEARAAYKRCEPFLRTTPIASDANEGADRVLKALLEARGMSKEEAQKIDISSKSDVELVELFKKLGASSSPVAIPLERSVPVVEVDELLQQGWRFVATLDPEHTILRAP